jgi:hypothetical protein
MTNLELLLRLLPESVAIHQAAYERRRQALRAHQAGVSRKVIAARLGVSTSRVSQMIIQAMEPRRAPIEFYFRDIVLDCQNIARLAARLARPGQHPSHGSGIRWWP